MFFEHDFTITGKIFKNPTVKINPFGKHIQVTIVCTPLSIPTKLGNMKPFYLNGSYSLPSKGGSWVNAEGVPNWIVKDNKVLVKGILDGRVKENENVPSGYYCKFSDILPQSVTDAAINHFIGRGEIAAAAYLDKETKKESLFLMKEQVKKTKPDDPVKHRYYRVLTVASLNVDSFIVGKKPMFMGQVGKDVLPVPTGADLYHISKQPLFVANEAFL